MITEGIVGQLGNQPMILVSISVPMGQDQSRIKVGFDRLKVVLDLGTLEREIPIAKPTYIDPLVCNTLKECRCAVFGFSFANLGCTEDYPSHCQVGDLRDKAQNGSTAANLNIIGMSTQAKQLQ
jgi:hypothetical protein